MEKNVSGFLAVLAVIFLVSIGLVYNAGVDNGRDSVNVPVAEVCPEVEIPEPVEKLVADSSLYLNLAVDDFMEYVDDEELFECKNDSYNLDEISVVRVYDNWNLGFNDKDYTVNFNIKLEYDEDDERSCKKVFEVEVEYEEDEDVKVFLD